MFEIIILWGAGFTLLLWLIAAILAPIHNWRKHNNAVGWEWGDTFCWTYKEDYESK